MPDIDDNDVNVGRGSGAAFAVLTGIVGPTIMVLNAVGVDLRAALASGLAIVVLMVVGACLLMSLGLGRVASSTIGLLVIGGAVSLGMIAALSQLFGAVISRNHAWIVGLLVASSGLFSNSNRVLLMGALRKSAGNFGSEIVPLWVSILSILGVSDWSFAALALAIAGVHWIVSAARVVRVQKQLGYVVLWVFLFLFRVSTDALGWRTSPWAFSLGSLDNHIWVAGAWAVDQFGWTADPTTAGVESSYHFLGQAMAGMMSRLIGIEIVASVGILVPVLVIGAAFFSIRTVLGCWSVAARNLTWLPVLVLLSAYSPLEPNSPFSTESFTHMVSAGYFCVLVAALAVASRENLQKRLVVGLALIVLLIGLAKVFTGAIAIGVMLTISATQFVFGKKQAAKAGLRHAAVAAPLLLGLYLLVYARTSSSTVFSVEVGFGALEYRYGLVGGPYVNWFLSILLLVMLFWTLWFGLHWVVPRFRARAELDLHRAESIGFVVAATGLGGAALVLDFPPVGYAERYFSSIGVIMALIAGLAFAANELEHGHRTRPNFLIRNYLVAPAVVVLGISSAALLWVHRLQGWPSSQRFLVYYLMPSIALVAIVGIFALVARFRTGFGHHPGSRRELAALSFLALAVVGVGANVGYALRGPLNTFVGYVAGRVSGADFVAEVKESGDRSSQYRGLLDAVRIVTPAHAVVASNADTELQLFIASESQRQLWWSSYIESLPRVDERLTAHLEWRGAIIRNFAEELSADRVREMRSCGVTHYVLDAGSPGVQISARLGEGVSRVYEDGRYTIFELSVDPDPAMIPEKQWLRWCTTNPSA